MTKEGGMFGLSTEMANSFANWTYLIAGGLAVFFTATTVAASWVMWKTSTEISEEKDRQLSRFQSEAQKQSALLEKEAAKANERAAEANARAVQAQLDLEKYKAPRSLDATQRARIIEQMSHALPQQFDVSVSGDAESLGFVEIIEEILNSAGWVQVDWKYSDAIFGGTVFPRIGSGKPIIGNSNIMGIEIRMNPHQSVEFLLIAEMLAHSLRGEDIQAKALDADIIERDNDGAIHIMVGKKP